MCSPPCSLQASMLTWRRTQRRRRFFTHPSAGTLPRQLCCWQPERTWTASIKRETRRSYTLPSMSNNLRLADVHTKFYMCRRVCSALFIGRTSMAMMKFERSGQSNWWLTFAVSCFPVFADTGTVSWCGCCCSTTPTFPCATSRTVRRCTQPRRTTRATSCSSCSRKTSIRVRGSVFSW